MIWVELTYELLGNQSIFLTPTLYFFEVGLFIVIFMILMGLVIHKPQKLTKYLNLSSAQPNLAQFSQKCYSIATLTTVYINQNNLTHI